jgi:hypothetical protein
MLRTLLAVAAVGIAAFVGARAGSAQSAVQMSSCNVAKEWWAGKKKRDMSAMTLPMGSAVALKALRYLNNAGDTSKVLAFCPPGAAPFSLEDVKSSVKAAADDVASCAAVGRAVQNIGNLPSSAQRTKASLQASGGLTLPNVIGYQHTLAEFRFWAAIQPDVASCVEPKSYAAALNAARAGFEPAGVIVQKGSNQCQASANAYRVAAEAESTKAADAAAGLAARTALSPQKTRALKDCEPFGADPKQFIETVSEEVDISLARAAPACAAVLNNPMLAEAAKDLQQRNADGAYAKLTAARGVLATTKTACATYPGVTSRLQSMVGDLEGLAGQAKR